MAIVRSWGPGLFVCDRRQKRFRNDVERVVDQVLRIANPVSILFAAGVNKAAVMHTASLKTQWRVKRVDIGPFNNSVESQLL